MTDSEYTRVTNRAALSIAKKALDEVIACDGSGVDKEEFSEVYEKISIMLNKVQPSIEVE